MPGPVVFPQKKITSENGWGELMHAMSRKLPAGFARIGTRANTISALRRGAAR